METEAKYIKKIRDALKKKTGGVSKIFSGPNTKAKYLNDIAKTIDGMDIGGGGDSKILVVTLTYENGNAVIDKTADEILQARDNHKSAIIIVDKYVAYDRDNGLIIPLRTVDEDYIYFEYDYVSTGMTSIPTVNKVEVKVKKADNTVRYDERMYSYAPLNRALPVVDASDNGKILKVVDGVWTAVTP